MRWGQGEVNMRLMECFHSLRREGNALYGKRPSSARSRCYQSYNPVGYLMKICEVPGFTECVLFLGGKDFYRNSLWRTLDVSLCLGREDEVRRTIGGFCCISERFPKPQTIFPRCHPVRRCFPPLRAILIFLRCASQKLLKNVCS